ncbi:reverse transcriptase domain-containing protein [Tanacetum coccineum]
MRTRSSLEYTIPRRRNCRRSRHQQEAIPLIPEPEIPMADDRPMAEQLQAPTGGFERGNNEEPHAHIRHFESITNNQRYPDVPNTTIKLLLFPFSLDGTIPTNLRNEITNFRQIAQESFFEAWERFKELLRKCPHHGFSLMHQLDTFYNSLSYNDQDSLNSAAGGNFLYKSPTEGLQIIENKAKNNNRNVNANQGYNRTGNNGNQVNHGANSGLTQQAQAYQAPSTQVPVTYARFEAYTKANDVTLNNLQKNLNDFKREQQDFQNEQRNFQNMMLNMFQKQMGNNNASGSGTLPSNTITNPRCEARAITTRSGLSYTPVPPIPPPLFDENESLTEKETEVTKDKVLPSTKDIQPPVIQKSHDPVKPVSSPISPEPSFAQVNNSSPSKEPSKKTHLPYPQRMKAQKQKEKNDMQLHKFLEMFQKLHFNISLAEALVLMPKYTQMMKALLSNKEKLLEAANTPLTENCSAVIMKKLPEKLGDPGRFLIPCDFTKMSKCMALADLGASINLMPLGIYQKLKLPELVTTKMTLELANGSLAIPTGIAEDVLVKVGHFSFPADFVVVDYEVNYRVPLILGRPFLRTARVLIDVHGEELVIRDGMERIVFKPDGSQDKESIHMMDIYDDRFKDVCEPESNDSSSPTSTIVEEFDSLVGEIIKQKEEVKEISDPVARRRACFAKLENFRIIHQGRVIHSPKIASVSAISHIFPNNNLEDSFKMGDEDLNFIPNKELNKEDLIPIPRESKIGKECDFPLCDDFQSFKTFSNPLFEKKDDFPSRNDESILKEEVHKETLKSYSNPLFEDDEEIISIEVSRQISPKVDVKNILSFFPLIGNCVRKWATNEFVKDNDEINHEVFKSDNENVLGVHDNKEEEIAFLDGLLEDENFFEINDKKVEFLENDFDNDDDLFEMDSNNDEWKRILYGEDFERMDSDSDKTKDFDKSSSNVFKSLSDEFEPGGSSYVEAGIGENVVLDEEEDTFTFTTRSFLPFVTYPEVFRILEDSWFKFVEEQSNAHNFH